MSRRSLVVVFLLSGVILGCGSGEEANAPDTTKAAQEMADAHEDDTPTATAAARAPEGPVTAQSVTYGRTAEGAPITGYLAAPARPDSVLSARGADPASTALPGLVVIHEWWGLNDNVRTATRRLAGEGYRVLAVDLYADSTGETPEEAQALMQAATRAPEALIANLRAAHDHLRTEGEAPRVGVLGWCFGGGMTFRAVADRPTAFDAAVAYYGTPEALTPEALSALTTPVQAHFGRQDDVVPPKQVEAFRARLEGTDAPVAIYEYDAGHAFANPSGERYDPDAAATAWDRTTTFLRTHLAAPAD
jgi:carboxymethylenebutenolidase